MTAALHDELCGCFGDRYSTAAAVREHHGKDDSHHPAIPPDGVVFAQSTDDVAFAVRACARHGTPVIPFGAGTSIEGHVQAVHGGISIDMGGMNRVLAVRPDDLDATVEAGVTRFQLDRELSGARGCSSRSIRGPMRRSAGWRPRGRRGRPRFGTARCATT